MKRWEEIFSEQDRALAGKAFATRQQPGKRPALLIIDVNRAFLGQKSGAILEHVEQYPQACGEAGWAAFTNIVKLVEWGRQKKIPLVFTTPDAVMQGWCGRASKNARPTDPAMDEIPPPLTPLASEVLIRKTKASAFFATPLARCLAEMKVDSLYVAGTTTSGCVRATVVDACSHGFRCFVVEECTFDRFELSHLVSLFDMNSKYADVISLSALVDELAA